MHHAATCRALTKEPCLSGVQRDLLQLAWDFTTASKRKITNRLLSMRDDAFAKTGGDIPFTIVETKVGPDQVPGAAAVLKCRPPVA